MSAFAPVIPFDEALRRAKARENSDERLEQFGEVPFITARNEGMRLYGGDYLEKARKWCDNVYDTAVGQMSEDEEIKNVRRYIDYIQGSQWPETRPKYRPAPVINRIGKWFWDNLSSLTDVKLNMEVRTENPEFKELALNLTKATQSNYRNQDGIISLIFTVMHATLSMGYTKVGFDHQDRNDVVYLPLGSDSVFPVLGSLTDFQQSAGVVYRAWKPLTWFQERFPAMGNMVRAEGGNLENYAPDKPYGMDTYTWNAIAPGLRDYLYSDTRDTQGDRAFGRVKMPVALYTEFWFRDPQLNTSRQTLKMGYGNSSYDVEPGERIYPFGRMISTAHQYRRVILNDVPNWHWHGLYPFAPLRLGPVPWSWTGLSDMRDLIPIQDPINKALAEGLSLLSQATNKTMVTKEGSMSPATWNAYFPGMPAAKIKLLNRLDAIDSQIKWIGPDIGALTAVPPMYELLKRAFDEQSGQFDMNRLAAKKQVPSSDSIQEMRESQQGRYRIKGILLESYFNQMGRLVLSDIIQFYTRKKVISMLGPDGLGWEYFDYDPDSMVPASVRSGPYSRGRDFVRQFAMMVAAGSALPAQRREMAQLGIVLWKLRAIGLESLYKILNASGANLPDAKTELERLKAQAPLFAKPSARK